MEANNCHRLNAKSAHRSAVVVSREQQHLQRQVTGIEKQKRQAANELRFLQNKLIDRAAAKHLVPSDNGRDTPDQRPRSRSSPAVSRRATALSLHPAGHSNKQECAPSSPVASRRPTILSLHPAGHSNTHDCAPKPPPSPTSPTTTMDTLCLPPISLNYPAGWDPGRRSTIGCLREPADGLPIKASFHSLGAACLQKPSSQTGRPIRQSRSREDLNETTRMAAAENDKPTCCGASQPKTVFFYSSNMTPRSPTVARKSQLLNVKEAMQNMSNLRRWSSGPELRTKPDAEKPDLAAMSELRYIRLPPARTAAATQHDSSLRTTSGTGRHMQPEN